MAKHRQRKIPQRRIPNPKRKLAPVPDAPQRAHLRELSLKASYGGNPDHKRNPGNFGLGPPSNPRLDDSLCDDAGITSREEALRLLRRGLDQGLVSVQVRNGWPQNVWAITNDGIALEAELENEVSGSYHGYPMLRDEPLAEDVRQRWRP